MQLRKYSYRLTWADSQVPTEHMLIYIQLLKRNRIILAAFLSAVEADSCSERRSSFHGFVYRGCFKLSAMSTDKEFFSAPVLGAQISFQQMQTSCLIKCTCALLSVKERTSSEVLQVLTSLCACFTA